MQGLATWQEEMTVAEKPSSIEKEVKKELTKYTFTEIEKKRVDKKLDQFRRDRLPLTLVKQYLRLFNDYYRYNKRPPQKFSDYTTAVKTHDQQVADTLKIHDGMEFGEYKQRPEIEEGFEKAQALVEHPDFICAGTGLMLLGSPGTGKTALAKSICRKVGDHAFISAPKLIRLLKDHNNRERSIIVKRLETATLVVIDDLGQEYRSDFTDSELDHLIAERERNNHSIIITSNFTLKDMEGSDGYATRMTDRLKSRCFVVEMQGESYRQEQGANING